jgi:hypothetical protein
MTNPATALSERLRRTLTGVERRLDTIERAQNAAELHLPVERVPDGAGRDTLRIRPVWATPGLPDEAREPTPTIEMADLEPLGPVFGWSFMRQDAEHEVRLDAEILPAALNDRLAEGRVFVHEVVPVKGEIKSLGDRLVPSLDHTIDRYFRATIVPTGTYAREHRRWEQAEAARKPHRLPVLSDRPVDWPLGRELLPWLARKGIECAMVDGRLVATAVRRPLVLPQLAAAIDSHAPLIVGWLTNAPVPCFRTKCNAEAATVLLGGAPACQEHAA